MIYLFSPDMRSMTRNEAGKNKQKKYEIIRTLRLSRDMFDESLLYHSVCLYLYSSGSVDNSFL